MHPSDLDGFYVFHNTPWEWQSGCILKLDDIGGTEISLDHVQPSNFELLRNYMFRTKQLVARFVTQVLHYLGDARRNCV